MALAATAGLAGCLIALAVFDAPWLGLIAMVLLIVALTGRLIAEAGGSGALLVAGSMVGIALLALLAQLMS